jgi:peptidoglycan/xylan/chitin deacetylase (PgdA/CDA1 family)
MKAALIAALVLLAISQAALAAYRPPEPVLVPLPSAADQNRAVAHALASGAPVYCGGETGNAVALTFDDGPGPYTAQVVDDLRAAGAHATFFLVGNRLQYWSDAARDETQVGAIGNHSWSHPMLPQLQSWLVWLEVMRTQYEVAQDVGREPRLFRVPYAEHTKATDAIVRKLGLLEVFWDVDARDDVPNAKPAVVVRNVVRGLRPGAIVVMHDIHPWTAQALPKILDAIRARGLRAVSVPELLALDPPSGGCPYAPVKGD